MLSLTRGLRHLILRISNPFGPGGESSQRSHCILNHFVQKAVRGETIRLFGDGSQRRDYIFVPDLVSAMLRAAVAPACSNDTFNLGGGIPVSLAEAAHLVSVLTGSAIERVPWPKHARDVETGDSASDTRKLVRLVGPLPATPFRQAIEETIAFYRELDRTRVGRPI